MTRSERLAITLVPLAAVVLVATRYRHTWYFYDEWTMFERVLTPNAVRGTFEVFNGHLYSFPNLTYRAQLALGIDGHGLVWLVFCITLVASNISIARFLWAAGVPVLAATAAGTAITYFGPGAQLMTLEFQFGTVGAIACSFFAAYVALRTTSSWGHAVAIAILLLATTGFDSGAAAAGVAFVAVLLALRWRDRWAVVALAPSILAGAAVFVAAQASPRSPAGLGTEIAFGAHLVLRAAGGIVGGARVAGAIVLVAAGALFVPAIVSGRMDRAARDCLAAGLFAAFVMTVTIATTRAGLVGGDFLNFNRYIAIVAVYLLVALLPPAVSVADGLLGRRKVWIGPVVTAIFALTFLLNLSPLLRYRRLAEGWQAQTHALVAQTTEQLARGCPNGAAPSDAAHPLGFLGPQVTVKLVRELVERGSLHRETPPVRITPAVHDAMCAPQ